MNSYSYKNLPTNHSKPYMYEQCLRKKYPSEVDV